MTNGSSRLFWKARWQCSFSSEFTGISTSMSLVLLLFFLKKHFINSNVQTMFKLFCSNPCHSFHFYLITSTHNKTQKGILSASNGYAWAVLMFTTALVAFGGLAPGGWVESRKNHLFHSMIKRLFLWSKNHMK